MKNYLKLIISLLIPLLIGYASSLFNIAALANWYPTLTKPTFNPPSAIFGPVWTILYLMIGLSLYFLWTARTKREKKTAYIFFTVQLILNFFWTFIFFGLNKIFPALIEIIILWITILLTIIYSYKISKKSAYLLIPYLLWVTFATILNFAFWILN